MEAQRAEMVERQLRKRGIADERVLAAMAEVPREEFVTPSLHAHAYDDGALPLGHGQTISQPWVVAAMCEALALEGSERVLEVGTGSGYSTAILSILAGEGGSVTSLEIVAELAEEARGRLATLGYRAEVIAGDGRAGAAGPWDAIVVNAAAKAVPPALEASLAANGTLVIPITRGDADMLTALRRVDPDESLEATTIAACRFVPLVSASDR